MTKLLIFLAFFSVSALARTSGDWSKIPSAEFEMADFPEAGSKALRKDFEVLLKYQKSRSKAQCDLAKRQQHPTYEAFWGKTEVLDADLYDNTKELGERVAKFSERVATYFKGKFDRPRPYSTNSEIKPCVTKVAGAKSYPSSHAAVAIVTGCMLGELYPDSKADIETYAQELGELRAIIGVHHPSDVAAGQKLGLEICQRLMEDPDFQAELKAIKK